MSATATPPTFADTEAISSLEAAFAAQKRAFVAHPFPDVKQRRADLYALADAILAHRRQIRAALRSDFGAHADPQADLIEVAGPVARATAAAKEVKHWMEPERRPVERLSFGTSKAMVAWQPKGVVGIIVPWNFPVELSLGPLADNLAAGNRVIIKMSEYSPACGALVAQIVAGTFAPDHVTVVNGGVELGRRFAAMRWDHLLFTGNPEVGRSVAVAAAQNLVPVTLELGGKNPAIFAEDIFADEEELVGHVRRMLGVKLVKGGQMCISIDHCLVPRARMEDFVRIARQVFTGDLGDYSRSDGCTGIISPHFQRQLAMLEEARASGARVVQRDARGGVDEATRRLPASLVIDPDPTIALMNEEVFGPVLPVIPYDSLEMVLSDIAHGERPLGLYVFTNDEELAVRLQRETSSGGFCVNAAAAQGSMHTLGFGGVGRSGYGRHHGHDGFKEFSNPRGAFVLGRAANGVDAFFPPYTAAKRKQIEQLFGLRRVQLRVAKTLKPGRRRR